MNVIDLAVLLLGSLAAILGLFFKSRIEAKLVILVVIVVTTAFTFLGSMRKSEESQYNRELINHLVRSAPPSQWFIFHIRDRINELLSSKELYINTSAVEDLNALFLVYRKNDPDKNLAGVLCLTEEDFKEIMLMPSGEVEPELRERIFGDWNQNNVGKNFSAIQDTLVILFDYATKVGFTASYTSYNKGKEMETIFDAKGFESISIYFESEDIDTLLSLAPIYRDLHIAEKFRRIFPELDLQLSVARLGRG